MPRTLVAPFIVRTTDSGKGDLIMRFTVVNEITKECRALAVIAVGCVGMFCGGCASYRVPGSAADFRALGITAQQADAMTDVSIREHLDRKPLARFPASMAILRLQGREYCS